MLSLATDQSISCTYHLLRARYSNRNLCIGSAARNVFSQLLINRDGSAGRPDQSSGHTGLSSGHVRRLTADGSNDVITCLRRPASTCPLFVSVLLVSTPVYLCGRTRIARPEPRRQRKQRGVAGQKRAPGSRHTTGARGPNGASGPRGRCGDTAAISAITGSWG